MSEKWKIVRGRGVSIDIIEPCTPKSSVYKLIGSATSSEHGERIVTAVNNHEPLVKALREAKEVCCACNCFFFSMTHITLKNVGDGAILLTDIDKESTQ